MTSPDPLKEITRRLRDAVDEPGDVEAMPAGRDAAIARIEEALRARGRTQRRRRFLRAPAAAAAVLLLVGGGALAVHRAHHEPTVAPVAQTQVNDGSNLGRLQPSGAVTAIRDGHTEPVAQGDRLPEGTELRTSGAAEASLDFESGTHITLGAASRVRLVEQTAHKRFALESGSLSAKVAKLGPDERFVVATSDAQIEVRGTAFRVTIVAGDAACENGTPTRLDVSEGVVVVRHAGTETRVSAGGRWPACAPVSMNVGPAMTISSGPSPPPVVSGVPTVARPAPSSRLAEQNDLFDEAMRRKRDGDTQGAVKELDRLLRAYPTGPLAESAAAERKRLLAAGAPVGRP